METPSMEKKVFDYIVDNPDSTMDELKRFLHRGDKSIRNSLQILINEKLVFVKVIKNRKYYSTKTNVWKGLDDFFPRKGSLAEILNEGGNR